MLNNPQEEISFIREHPDRYAHELLDNIAEMHRRLKARVDGNSPIVSVRATTAVTMTDDLREKVKEKARELFRSDVYLTEFVDPSIMGGIILEGPTRRYDASVRAQLANVRRTLTSATTGDDV